LDQPPTFIPVIPNHTQSGEKRKRDVDVQTPRLVLQKLAADVEKDEGVKEKAKELEGSVKVEEKKKELANVDKGKEAVQEEEEEDDEYDSDGRRVLSEGDQVSRSTQSVRSEGK